MDIIRLNPLDRLFTALLADIDRLNVRLDVPLAGQFQHTQHLRSISNMASSYFASVGSEILRHHSRQGLVGKSDVVEFAIDVQGGHVFLDIEGVGHVCGVENEVEFEGVGLGPVFLRGDDEFFGAHFFGVGFFVGGVGEGVDFGAKGRGPEDSEVAKTTPGKWC